ncbi:6-aminohexanoate-cyclic-dimer hydrolase [bacterium BMS3Abin02]|nr:6-aminohexanoate-cyclic-dimer hydrolase [bacterium BMS3Abin02]
MTAFAEYTEYDAIGLADLVRNGDVRPSELVEAAISRIEQFDPRLNAVVHKMYDRALAQATRSPDDGPFSGVPFLLKDLTALYEGEPTTASSRFLEFFVADEDSVLVSRYRKAGLLVLGKTNTPEFGLVAVTEPALRGPTRNPWNLDHTPGGSSGGSAAAVAAGFVPAAHGGDGGGSIRIPSSACGLFGLKPSRGRNPLGPHFDGNWLGLVQEHVLSRSVRDSAAMLDISSRPAVGEPLIAPTPDRPFLEEAHTDPGRLRVALCTESLFGTTTHGDCIEAAEKAAALLESLGHDVEEACPPFDKARMVEAYLRIVAAGLAADIAYAARLVGKKPERDYFEPVTWLMMLIGRKTRGDELASLLLATQENARRIAIFHETYDVLLTPTLGRPPVKIGELRPSRRDELAIKAVSRFPARKVLDFVLEEMAAEQMDPVPNTMLFNLTGQPAMSVPLHWNASGLPIGVQFAGRYGDEATLLRLAGQLEAAQPWVDRRPLLA